MATVPGARTRSATALVVLAALLLSTLAVVLAARAPAGAEPAVPGTAEPERRYAPGIDPTLAADATLRGTVLGPDGKLRDNVLVEAFSALDPTGDPVASDLTYEVGDVASHGAYTLHLPAGDYLVRYSTPEGRRVVLEPTYYGGGAGTTVTLAPEQDLLLDPVALRKDQGAPVTGRVVDAAGEPMAEVRVMLVRVLGPREVSARTDLWTAEDGTYRFERVARERAFTVYVSGGYDDNGDPLPSTWLGGQPSWLTAETFTLGSRSTGRDLGDHTLRAGTSVTGRVTSPDGPVEGGDVALIALNAAGDYGAVVAWDWVEDPDDTYEFVAPSGRYTVGIQTYGEYETGSWVFLGDTRDLSKATSFTIAAAPYDAGTLTVGADTRAVRFQLLDHEGAPAEEDYYRPMLLTRDRKRLVYARELGGGYFQARIRWGAEFTIGTYDDDEGYYYYLGDTTTWSQARFLTAAASPAVLDAGVLSLALPAPTADVLVLGGRARNGQLLAAGTPTWSVAGVESTYQWLRDGTAIPGQTASSYLLRAEDVGHRVAVRVTGRVYGHTPGTVTSTALLVGPGEAPSAIRPPSLTGRAVLGGTLTATPPTWDTDGVTTGYAWYADAHRVPNASGPTLTLTWPYAGATITVTASGARAGYATGTSTSRAVAVDRADPGVVVSLRKGDLRVELHAPGALAETGPLALYDGKRLLVRADLARRDRGVWTFDLADLRRGKHQLSVRYGGSDVLLADRTRALKVRIR